MNVIHFLDGYVHYIPWVLSIFVGLMILLALLHRLPLLLAWRQALKRDGVQLQLIPPVSSTSNARANAELMRILHGIRLSRSWKDKLFCRQVVLTAEMRSTYEGGICFVLHVDKDHADQVRHELIAHTPHIQIVELEDTPSKTDRLKHIVSYKLKSHWGFALAHHVDHDTHDPLLYLLNAMANVRPGEEIIAQLVITPIDHSEAYVIAQKAMNNEDVIGYLRGKKIQLMPLIKLAISKISLGSLDLLSSVTAPSSSYGISYTASQRQVYDQVQVAKHLKPMRQLSETERNIHNSVHFKVEQPLFRVALRVGITTANPRAAKARVNAIRSALMTYNVSGYQGFVQKRRLPGLSRYSTYSFEHCMPPLTDRRNAVLSASELASLFHFPATMGKADNLVTSLSPSLAAPVSLKQTKEFDVVFGENHHHGTSTSIGLTAEERDRHVYVVGGTGSGKTTMLQYMIVQDMRAGKGLAVIDPHGDMAMTILKYIPKNRLKDVIYFDPDDFDHPIGLNLLELKPGLTGNDYLRDRDRVTSTVVSVFRKIFSEDDTGGHRIEYVLRNTVLTALTVEGATLFTVLKLLQNSKFRKKIVDALEDEDLKDFWRSELGQAGNMQRVKMSAGVTNKIGRFNSSAAAKFVLGQEKSTIDFEDIINSGKILICNFSKALGEDVSELFGITILAKLQLAALRRAKLSPEKRRPFYLYVDEFQNFATPSFVQMLSESRKYKLFMTMAEQSTSQQQDLRTVQVILANVGSVICFKTANTADERLLLPMFQPYLDEGKLANLSAYNFYAKLSAVHAQEPLSGQTLLLKDSGDETMSSAVIAESRKTFAGAASRIEHSIPDSIVSQKNSKLPKSKKSETDSTKIPAKDGMLDKS